MSRRSLLVAYLLWFFFGLLGIHRFYLGRPVSGVIWLLTGGIFGIGWLVDLLLTWFMVEEENERLFYGRRRAPFYSELRPRGRSRYAARA